MLPCVGGSLSVGDVSGNSRVLSLKVFSLFTGETVWERCVAPSLALPVSIPHKSPHIPPFLHLPASSYNPPPS